jgi:SAM-dependent methyltransferase
MSQSKSAMMIHRLRSFEDYLSFKFRAGQIIAREMAEVNAAIPPDLPRFTVPGFSYPAGRQVQFMVDYGFPGSPGNPSWRERAICPVTTFNNRMRGAIHIFDLEAEPYPDSHIYLTEQVTAMYKYFKDIYPNTIGSEYMGDRIPLGGHNEQGIRNEDLTALSFDDESFDALVSLDVLEHIPNTLNALNECRRVLKPGGRALISAPFNQGEPKNILRATIENGVINHILEPEYHGDPLSKEGILSFHDFGWEILDQFKKCGFRDAYTVCYFSRAFGYLGDEQFIFSALA